MWGGGKGGTWDYASGGEGDLLRLVVEVGHRCVDDHAPHWLPMELLLRPVLQQ